MLSEVVSTILQKLLHPLISLFRDSFQNPNDDYISAVYIVNLQIGKQSVMDMEEKDKMWNVGLIFLEGSSIIPRRCCVCGFSLSGSECAVESFPSTLTQIMCYILQANLNGRFLRRPLPMTSHLSPAKLQLRLTQLVTRPKREPNVATERQIGAERDTQRE